MNRVKSRNKKQFERRKARTIKIGSVAIGGANPVAVQSMTNVRTSDFSVAFGQIRGLINAGCDIVRLAVVDEEDAKVFKKLKSRVKIPLVADIHFDYRLALKAIENGADKVRINPGNIGSDRRVKLVIQAAKKANIPVRIGVNAGSLEDRLKGKARASLSSAMVSSAVSWVRKIERWQFKNLVVSLKSADAPTTIAANRLISEKINYPLHLGVTSSGAGEFGIIKSVSAVSALLAEGIGDTFRISLADDPVKEVKVAREVLEALGLRPKKLEVIACPTCGRCRIDVVKMYRRVSEKLRELEKRLPKSASLKIAVMGCAVNGPGEAKNADFGIAGGDKEGLIFKGGKPLRKVKEDKLVDELLKEIKKFMRDARK